MDRDLSVIVESARAGIVRRWPVRPCAAVILGTGLGRWVRHVRQDIAIPFQDLPGFPCATAPGHCGRVVCGCLGGVPLILLDGRCHLYEGYSVEAITLPVRVLHACGAPLLLVSNAGGGLDPRYAPGDLVVIDDHINLMGRTPGVPASRTFAGRGAREQPSPYDAALVQAALRIARRRGFVAHRGVYVGVTGPNYETRAEYRFLRRIGGDLVGMSTVPEATVGRALGMRVLGLSVVTNVAVPDAPQAVAAADVVDVAAHAEPRVHRILADILHDGV
jgi:purine-nucleoside phosphorylase